MNARTGGALGWIMACGGMAVGLQAWLWSQSPVPSLDAVRFVRSAALVEQLGLEAGLSQLQEGPLWILWIWAVHQLLLLGGQEVPGHWAISVQLAGILPLLVSFFLVGILAIRRWGKQAGLAAAALFCSLPEVARLGVDGLSDSLHLTFAGGCVLALAEAAASGEKPRAFAWAAAGGILAGLASLVRLEVWVVVGAWIATMAGLWLAKRLRIRFHRLLGLTGGLLLGIAVVEGIWLGIRSGFFLSFFPCLSPTAWQREPAVVGDWADRLPRGTKTSLEAAFFVGTNERLESARQPWVFPHWSRKRKNPSGPGEISFPGWVLPDGTAPCFAPKDPSITLRRPAWRMLGRSVHKMADVWGYWVGALALFGLWEVGRSKGGWRRLLRAENLFLAISAGGTLVGASLYGAKLGYLEARHLVLMVVCGIGAAGAGAQWLGDHLVGLRPSWSVKENGLPEGEKENCPGEGETGDFFGRIRLGGSHPYRLGRLRALGSKAPLLLAVTASLGAQVGPLHGSRLGHRLAGQYLAQHSRPGALVVDTHGWTGLYSGRRTYMYWESAFLWTHPGLEYVVVEAGELRYGSQRAKTLRNLLHIGGERIGVFPPVDDPCWALSQVELYRWNAQRFREYLEGNGQGCWVSASHWERDRR